MPLRPRSGRRSRDLPPPPDRLPRWHAEPLPEKDDHRVGRRPPRLRRHPLPRHGAKPAAQPSHRGQRGRSDRAQGATDSKATGCVLQRGRCSMRSSPSTLQRVRQPHPDRRAGPRGPRPATHVAGLRCRDDGGVGQELWRYYREVGNRTARRHPGSHHTNAPPRFHQNFLPEWSIVRPRALGADDTGVFQRSGSISEPHLPVFRLRP